MTAARPVARLEQAASRLMRSELGIDTSLVVKGVGWNTLMVDWDAGVVVRMSSDPHSDDSGDRFLKAVTELRAEGAPIAAPLAPRVLRCESTGIRVSVWPAVEQPEWGRATHSGWDMTDIGALIGKLHRHPISAAARDLPRYSIDHLRPEPESIRKAAEFIRLSGTKVLDASLEQSLCEHWARLSGWFSRRSESDDRVVHRDVYPPNIAVDSDRGGLVLIDLDTMATGPAEIEFGTLLNAVRRYGSDYPGIIPAGCVRPDLTADELVEQLGTEAVGTTADLSIVDTMAVLQEAADVLLAYHRYLRHPTAENRTRARTRLRTLREPGVPWSAQGGMVRRGQDPEAGSASQF